MRHGLGARAEQERSAVKFRGIVESAPDALVGVDADGRIAVVNEKVEALFGYSRAELLGKPMHILWPRRLPAVSHGPASAPAGGAALGGRGDGRLTLARGRLCAADRPSPATRAATL